MALALSRQLAGRAGGRKSSRRAPPFLRTGSEEGRRREPRRAPGPAVPATGRGEGGAESPARPVPVHGRLEQKVSPNGNR